MSETNYPYGHGGDRSHPGDGYQGPYTGPNGDAEAPPTSGGPFGAVPSGPTTGSAPSVYAPPTSASSAGPGPWAASAPSASAAPSGAQGTPALSAAQAGAALRKVGIGNPLPTFAIGALSYVVALGASLVVIVSAVLTALAANTGGTAGGTPMPIGDPTGGPTGDPNSPSGGSGWQGIVGLVGIPFQLVSLASFGSYGIEVDMGFLGSLVMNVRGMPLLITVAMVGTAFLAARLVQRRWGTGRRGSNGPLGALLWSGISGLAVAIFAVIVTRVTAFSFEEDTMGMSLSMHSAGADMFFGTWALVGIPLFLGHIAGSEKPAWWPVMADLAAAPRLALVHALAFAVPVSILISAGGAIAMVNDGDGQNVLSLLLALPIWGLTGLALLAGMAMLSVPTHLTLQGGVEDLGIERTDEFLWFFDLPWYAWIPIVLIALLMPVVVALLWNRDREIDTGNILAVLASWAALPLAYFGGSVVLLALVWTSMQAEIAMLGDISMTVGLAAWLPVVAFFLGLVVEVLARFGAPFVDRFVPGLLVNWFRRSARARRADATPSTDRTPPGQVSAAPFFPGA